MVAGGAAEAAAAASAALPDDAPCRRAPAERARVADSAAVASL